MPKKGYKQTKEHRKKHSEICKKQIKEGIRKGLFQKGHRFLGNLEKPNYFKIGETPWNYIDGRSRNSKIRKKTKGKLNSHIIWCSQKENLSYLPKGFIIHHIDGNGDNDNPNNLMLMPDRLHRSWHNKVIKIWRKPL